MDTTVQTMVYFTPLDEMTVTVLAIVYFVYYIDAPRIIVGSDDLVQVNSTLNLVLTLSTLS